MVPRMQRLLMYGPYSQPWKQQKALQGNGGNVPNTKCFADLLYGTSSFMISLIWSLPVPFCGAAGIAVSCPFVSFDVFKVHKANMSAMPKNNNNKFHLIIIQQELAPA